MNSRLRPYVLLASLTLASVTGAVRAAPVDRAQKSKECEALRMNYAASAAYHPYDDVVGSLRVQCSEQMVNKNFAKVIELVELGLRRDPYNIHLLRTEAAAYRASGNPEKAEEIRALWYGLMDSILNSGDGLGYRSAFQVITTDEEDAVLETLHLVSNDKRTITRKGVQYDVFKAEDTETHESREVYFNVDRPKRWQAQQAAAAKPLPPP